MPPTSSPRRAHRFRFPMIVEATGERVMIVKKHPSNQVSQIVKYEAEDGRIFGPSQRLGHLVPFDDELDAVPVEDEPFEGDGAPSEHDFF